MTDSWVTSLTPGACSNTCPQSRWCHPTISFSVVPFSSFLQFFPASESFLTSQFFASGGQSIGVSASTSVLLMNTKDWSPLGWTGWISLQSKGFKSFLQHHSSKVSILQCLAFFMLQLSHSYMTTGKTIALTRQTFVGKVMSLLFNMLSRLVITFLPRHSFFPKTQEVHCPQGASLVLCQSEISSRGTDPTFSPQPWSRKSCSKRLTWSWKPYIFLFIYKAYFVNKGKEYWFLSLLMH